LIRANDSIVCGLLQASSLSIPKRKHNYCKYWWDEELMLLKEKAIQSFNMWASVGKSRNETVFDNMRRDKANYKRAISGIKKKSRANEFSDSLIRCLTEQGYE